MANRKTLALILIIVLVSFLGFIVENVFISFFSGKMDNRNMVLPFLLGYGLSILALYKLFGTPSNPLFFSKEIIFSSTYLSTAYYLVVTFLCVSIGELILGHLVEWICGIQWWNYTAIPWHITRYTSVPTSTIFSLLITVFMKYFFNNLLNSFSKLNTQVLSILSISLILLLSVDFIHSGIYMFKHHSTLKLWNIEFEKPIKEMLTNMKGNR